MANENTVGGEDGTEEVPANDETTQLERNAFQQGFTAGLPQDLQTNAHLLKFTSAEELGKEYLGLLSSVGKKGVQLPDRENSDDVNRYYTELGRPEESNGYELGEWQPPDGSVVDEEAMSRIKSAMWKEGITQDQFPAVMQIWKDEQEVQIVAAKDRAATAGNDTQKTLKEAFGNTYDEKMRGVGLVARAMFGDSAQEMFDSVLLADGRVMGDVPELVHGFVKLAELVGEDSLIGATSGDTNKLMQHSPESAKVELETLMADKEFAEDLFNKKAPGHKAAVAKREALYRDRQGAE
jgi:hypothetical protein